MVYLICITRLLPFYGSILAWICFPLYIRFSFSFKLRLICQTYIVMYVIKYNSKRIYCLLLINEKHQILVGKNQAQFSNTLLKKKRLSRSVRLRCNNFCQNHTSYLSVWLSSSLNLLSSEIIRVCCHSHTPPRGKHSAFHTCILKSSELIQIHVVLHGHTRAKTLWRIDKQLPGAVKCSLNKQASLLSVTSHSPSSVPHSRCKPQCSMRNEICGKLMSCIIRYLLIKSLVCYFKTNGLFPHVCLPGLASGKGCRSP